MLTVLHGCDRHNQPKLESSFHRSLPPISVGAPPQGGADLSLDAQSPVEELAMQESPKGQMTWRLPGQLEPVLHLRPYTECPQYMVPDKPDLSAGYATFVSLLRQQWQIIK
jgi:hypothetical protein